MQFLLLKTSQSGIKISTIIYIIEKELWSDWKCKCKLHLGIMVWIFKLSHLWQFNPLCMGTLYGLVKTLKNSSHPTYQLKEISTTLILFTIILSAPDAFAGTWEVHNKYHWNEWKQILGHNWVIAIIWLWMWVETIGQVSLLEINSL